MSRFGHPALAGRGDAQLQNTPTLGPHHPLLRKPLEARVPLMEILIGGGVLLVVTFGGLGVLLWLWSRLTADLARAVTEIGTALVSPQREITQPPDNDQEDITTSPPWVTWGDPDPVDIANPSTYVGPLSPDEQGGLE